MPKASAHTRAARSSSDSQQSDNKQQHQVKQESETTPSTSTAKPASKSKSKASAGPVYSADRYLAHELSSDKWVGAHVSASGGLFKAVHNAFEIGARAFAMDTRCKRKWVSAPLTADAIRDFKSAMEQYRFTPQQVLPHGSYLINLGSPHQDMYEKSLAAFIDELERCAQLGLELYNWHPGSTCGEITREQCLAQIAKGINAAHSDPRTGNVVTVIECMAGQGSSVGGAWEDIGDIISQVHDKSRVGLCIDTCHAFAFGHEFRTLPDFNHMMAQVDKIIGLKYLKGIHLNDSKGDLKCRKDRHANLGKGYIGMRAFHHLMNSPLLRHVPLILETPVVDESKWIEVYSSEIRQLYDLQQVKLEDVPDTRLKEEKGSIAAMFKAQSKKVKKEQDDEPDTCGEEDEDEEEETPKKKKSKPAAKKAKTK